MLLRTRLPMCCLPIRADTPTIARVHVQASTQSSQHPSANMTAPMYTNLCPALEPMRYEVFRQRMQIDVDLCEHIVAQSGYHQAYSPAFALKDASKDPIRATAFS